jgi:hypothetical protein
MFTSKTALAVPIAEALVALIVFPHPTNPSSHRYASWCLKASGQAHKQALYEPYTIRKVDMHI